MNAGPPAFSTPIPFSAPATFLERGVRVPFTSPSLASARARPGARSGLELLIPSLSGAAGTYVLGWDSALALCHPTLHDIMLVRRVGELRVITPAAIRRVARDIAAEGLAGREAAEAARAEGQHEIEQVVTTHFNLILHLISHVEARPVHAITPGCDPAFSIETRAKNAIAIMAGRLGCRIDELATHIEELAGAVGAFGIGANQDKARVPRALAALARLQQEVGKWMACSAPDCEDGQLLLDTAALTQLAARRVLTEANALLADIPVLLQRWLAHQGELQRVLARPEWLLDGWQHVCILWDMSEAMPHREEALAELVSLLPVMPAEVREWSGIEPLGPPGHRSHRGRTVLLWEDWRTGCILSDLVARNERARALSLGAH